MLFGAWGDKESEQKFSIDMAAAAHRNWIRDSNEKMFDDDFEARRSEEKSPASFEEVKIEGQNKDLPKAILRQGKNYSNMNDE